jgi:hypothetical protein
MCAVVFCAPLLESGSGPVAGKIHVAQLLHTMQRFLHAAWSQGRKLDAQQELLLLHSDILQKASNRATDMQQWWRELAAGRSALRQAGSQWRRLLTMQLQLLLALEKGNLSHVRDELLQALDMNGYFRKVADKQGLDTFT